MANMQEFRTDGSKVEVGEDGYIINPQIGDTDDDLTCWSCDVMGKVTLFDFEVWGVRRDNVVAQIERWLCDDCMKDTK